MAAAPLEPITDNFSDPWQLPAELKLSVIGSSGAAASRVPTDLIAQVAYLARHLESRFQGIPQDIEWTFDGEQLWLLQSRPITTLLPIWTRKIAAEVIPGVIRPLTWSINQPLTCGVWGDLFTLVLKGRAADIDFSQTATLHYCRAYFNATLLGDIFRRMGLPAESLDFLTRGAKFSKPPLTATLRNTPGLLRLLRRELSLPRRFLREARDVYRPAFAQWRSHPVSELSEQAIAQRIEEILALLKQATDHNIMAPLGLALWQAVLKVDLATLDNSQSPEVMALEELKALASDWRSLLPHLGLHSGLHSGLHTSVDSFAQPPTTTSSLFAALAEHPEGHRVFEQLDIFLDQYGYLSAVATDIAVPTWRESPQPVRELLAQYLFNPDTFNPGTFNSDTTAAQTGSQTGSCGWRHRQVQARLNIKGQVAEVYNRLLAELRGCFVEIESRWLSAEQLDDQGDIFFLSWEDIRARLLASQLDFRSDPQSDSQQNQLSFEQLRLKIALEKNRWQAQSPPLNVSADAAASAAASREQRRVPHLVYGHKPPTLVSTFDALNQVSSGTLQGIGASAGQAEGIIRVLEAMPETALDIDAQTILVVPYTDAGWSPLLARIGGLIAEVGGQLSHGAIIAREYGIPAVMDVSDATHRLTTGQRVRIDGQQGTIEIL
jgi:phosphohistidine swiveling domain-containing protein